MSIIKMKFLSIVGLKDYFDEFVSKYLVNSSLQLESALGVLENIKGLSHYEDSNPYSDLIKRSSSIINALGLEKEARSLYASRENEGEGADEVCGEIDLLESELKLKTDALAGVREQLEECSHMHKQLELLTGLDVDINNFFKFEFIKFRFGKMPRKNYKQLQLYVDDLEVIVIPLSQDPESIWMVYFTPRTYGEKVDGIFSSLHFERTRISGELKGTPAEALRSLDEKLQRLKLEEAELKAGLESFKTSSRERVMRLYSCVIKLNRIYEVRRFAAHTAESFYIIGWIPQNDLKAMMQLLDKDDRVIYIQEEPDLISASQPPTELNNNRIFRPFEALVRMYGLPSYNEIDPTAFVAITYFIMFGLMFGDVGQGLVLLAGGFLLMRLGVALGGVIIGAGLSSALFGLLYGSVFGFEEWLPHLWLKPMENINTMLITGIAVGGLLITCAMVLNITNGIKSRNLAQIFFDRNGVAGFLFYWGAIVLAVYFVRTGELLIPAGLTILFFIIPVAAMFFKEPLENLLHKRSFLPREKGMFFVQTVFEMLDMLLSFVSNTISFIRLSAFALNHAGLFMAVFILSEMAKGAGQVVVIIIGNILIIGLEGLIVGIQALRLEYYELFSRFFQGGGKPYRPLRNQNI